jgi:AbrB family transcriptional regulator (stage V sporulation protein T)
VNNLIKTGIIRKLDELGRIVIPKELRRRLRIKESEMIEIFTNDFGEIVFKKFSPIMDICGFAQTYTETLSEVSGHIVCVTDKEKVIAVSGCPKKAFVGRLVSSNFEKLVLSRNNLTSEREANNFVRVLEEEQKHLYTYEQICPIVSNGDVEGSVIFLSLNTPMTEADTKLAEVAANVLGKQINV